MNYSISMCCVYVYVIVYYMLNYIHFTFESLYNFLLYIGKKKIDHLSFIKKANCYVMFLKIKSPSSVDVYI